MGPICRYRVVPERPEAHLYAVSCEVPDPSPEGQVFALAAWTPGSYKIRDFARNVIELRTECRGRAVAVEKLDKQTWRCAPCEGPLAVHLRIYAWDPSVRAAHLDATHAFFDGASVLPRPVGRDRRPCVLDIQPPPHPDGRHWRVATAMTREGAPAWGFGTYRAASYEELIDHPVEMGALTLLEFDAAGVPHYVAIRGRHRADAERLGRDLRRLCAHHIGLFGAPPPMSHYLFLINAVGEGYGGLEHRASCALTCRRDALPRPGQAEVDDGYRELLGLCSHEYFHAWNVKRITPAAFVPYDLGREAYTRLLWAFEGITSYYDDLALARSGLIRPEGYLELLGRTITRDQRGAGRLRQTLAESSFDAWTRFYQQDENAPNAIVSYYTKGALVALALDLTLRRRSAGSRSLDDLMRLLWERHGRTGVGVPEDGVERLAEEIAGCSLQAFFDAALRGTEELPLASLLEDVGIDLVMRPAEAQGDRGGTPGRALDPRPRAVLGVRCQPAEGGVSLTHVLEGGAAQLGGLAAGDRVIAVDGLAVRGDGLEARIASYQPGDRVEIQAFRDDVLMSLPVALRAAPPDTCYLRVRDEVDAATRRGRAAWLGAPEGGSA